MMDEGTSSSDSPGTAENTTYKMISIGICAMNKKVTSCRLFSSFGGGGGARSVINQIVYVNMQLTRPNPTLQAGLTVPHE